MKLCVPYVRIRVGGYLKAINWFVVGDNICERTLKKVIHHQRMRDELLDGEIFLTLAETKYVVDSWRMDYNHYRSHSSLVNLTPVEFAESGIAPGQSTADLQQYRGARSSVKFA